MSTDLPHSEGFLRRAGWVKVSPEEPGVEGLWTHPSLETALRLPAAIEEQLRQQSLSSRLDEVVASDRGIVEAL